MRCFKNNILFIFLVLLLPEFLMAKEFNHYTLFCDAQELEITLEPDFNYETGYPYFSKPVQAKFSPRIDWQEISGQYEKRSKQKAFLLSLVVPGLGQRYADSNRKYQIFLGTELVLWAGFAGFRGYGYWLKEDYRTFAATHAGVNIDGKRDSYFTDLELFNSIYEYNDAMLRDRNGPAYYRDISSNYWQWDANRNRIRFQELRIATDRAFNRSMLALGIIVANHIVSAIDAMWTVHKQNKDVDEARVGMNLQYMEILNDPQYSINIYKRF